MIRLKRAHDPFDPSDGHRVLVDHSWPRGLGRESARIDEWAKDLAPSDALRRWYGHRSDRWQECQERYRRELKNPVFFQDLVALRELSRSETVTLLYGSRSETENQAVVLRRVLLDLPPRT